MSAVAMICLRCRIRLSVNTLNTTKALQSLGKAYPALRSFSTTTEDDERLPKPVGAPKTEAQQFLKQLKTVEKIIGEGEGGGNLGPTEEDAERMQETYSRLLSATKIGSVIQEEIKSYESKILDDDEGQLKALDKFDERFNFPTATHTVAEVHKEYKSIIGKQVVVHGFLRKARRVSKDRYFVDFYDYNSGAKQIQLHSCIAEGSAFTEVVAHQTLDSLQSFAPVAITATVGSKVVKKGENEAELQMKSIQVLNSVHKELIHTRETVYPPERRHLQLRTTDRLAKALKLRAKVASRCRKYLEDTGFLEVETPLLFKSTPEGAREFLVPTRNKQGGGGMCYALPQSPQQYKQILMASGVSRYYQLAKCFRDEDLRADRQPEFTQLDLEMSFSRGSDVINLVENLVRYLWEDCLGITFEKSFRRMTYHECMKFYGTDKPDMRFADARIMRIRYRRDAPKNFITEGFLLRPRAEANPAAVAKLVEAFKTEFSEPGADAFKIYVANEDTANGVPEAELTASDIDEINEALAANLGDIVVLKKRWGPLSGGNTKLGLLRTALISKAAAELLIHSPPPNRFVFTWVTDFPLFTPAVDTEPGQSGTAGLASTHHPFTAPHPDDFYLLKTSPSSVRAEHYDLVANGVELGGGSRRIHDPALQRHILENILKVHPKRIHEFDHLLEVLGSGCPPHAGIALGFDRMIALMSHTDSVRDVIAFPKNAKGVDPLVGAPSRATDEQLAEYWLKRAKEH